MAKPNNGQQSVLTDGYKWYRSITSKQVFSIVGPGGTGKTWILYQLIKKLGINLCDVLFVVYTGKATLPLRQQGLAARTIHSACYVRESDLVLDEFGKPIIMPTGRFKKSSRFVLKEEIPRNIKLIVVDEAGMCPKKMSDDLKSFGVKIIALGDKDQLPPVFGFSDLIDCPDVRLTEIMRQKLGDPIIFLSDLARKGRDIPIGKYGPKCFVVDESILKNPSIYLKSDMILCGRNKTRQRINEIIRHDIKKINSDLPVAGDKLVCRKNNWDIEINGIPLINGLFGYVINTHEDTFNGRSFNIDFMPECTPGYWLDDVETDYKLLIKPVEEKLNTAFPNGNYFEYGYGSTVHLAQGSQYGYVLGIEETMGSEEFQKKFMYTMISRAVHTLVLVKKHREIRQFFF